MNYPMRIGATAVCLAAFFLSSAAQAEGGFLESVGNVFDYLNQWRDTLGKKSEELLPPSYSPLHDLPIYDFENLSITAVPFEQTHPIDADSRIEITNRLGEVRINTWDQPLIKVEADIRVGGKTPDIAIAVAQNIGVAVHVSEEDKQVSIRTQYPDTRQHGTVATEVNYVLTIPAQAAVICDNTFGDTVIRDVGGAVAVNSRYGNVDIGDIGGPVSCSARGDFTLAAFGLRQGGDFEVHGMTSEFSGIEGELVVRGYMADLLFQRVSGRLVVNGYMGEIELRALGSPLEAEILNRNGPVRYFAGELDDPDIRATAVFGQLKATLPLETTVRSDSLLMARRSNVGSKQHISLYTTYDDITIQRSGGSEQPAVYQIGGGEDLQWDTTISPIPIPEGRPIVVDAMPGNIVCEGVDADEVTIEGVKYARSGSDSQAPQVLERLDLTWENSPERLVITTRMLEELSEMASTYSRFDLTIKCPRTSPLRITAHEGNSRVNGMGESVSIEQGKGNIYISHVKGTLDLFNREGGVEVLDSGGPLTISASSGRVYTKDIQGAQIVSNTDGNTVIVRPFSEVDVRSYGGDVTVNAYEGIYGDFDIRTEIGDIHILRTDEVDADFRITVVNGQVKSKPLISGSIHDTQREFRKIFNGGQHDVNLEAKNGNVNID